MAIKVTKTSRVNPATNSSHDSLLLPLTFFDLRWIKFHPTERVLFYKLHKHSSYHSLILPKLEHSLSTVLHHYLPLVGRLRWDPQDPKPHILVLPNDYVTLIVAESDADFSLLSRKGTRPETEIRSLVPELPASRDDSVFVLALQVTLFPNQGFSIGVTAHHSAMDGRSMSMFVRSWAHVCKHGNIGELTPCLDRTVINVPASLDARILEVVSYFSEDKTSSRSLKLPPSEEISPDTVRITLELTRENVEKLKERAKNENRLGSPVPESYFGSCVLSVGCFGHKAGVVSGEDGFVNAVEIISDSVRGVGSLDVEALCELYIDGTMRVEPGTQTVSIVGSNRFGLYQSDFGWGKPVACETVSIDRNEAFSMSERRDESGGVEIGLCLKKCEMDLFIDLFQNGL
ncbi:BnaA02g29930D [Brassica napus]|uniref:BnaA02g29930D protein n=1 Tax=Brassica napus TaxID=3708 RepID=A0A078I4B2_BRANA|nr:BnaA02g29930D [Brassica napus]